MTLKQIQIFLKEQANEEAKAATLKFVPDATKVYGIYMPVLNELVKKIKDGGFTLAEELWDAGSYEEKILAAKLIRPLAKKDPEKAIALVRRFSKEIDNWAVCDTLGMQSLKQINLLKTKEIFALSDALSISKNMWQRRLSLVLLEDFCKQKALLAEIKKRISPHKNNPEYYIKKAVVWLEASVNKKRS